MRLAVVAVVFAASVPAARAQVPPENAAHEHYRRGTAAYNLGKYLEAAKEYELAYEATLDPALLFNVAQSYRLGGDRKKAITTYRSYLRSAPNGSQRGIAEAKLKEVESQLDTERAPPPVAPPPAREQVAPAPLSPAPAAPPAEPVLSVSEPAVSSPPPAVLTLETQAAPAAPAPIYARWQFWAVAGAAAVAIAVVAIVLAGSSSNALPNTDLGTMRF